MWNEYIEDTFSDVQKKRIKMVQKQRIKAMRRGNFKWKKLQSFAIFERMRQSEQSQYLNRTNKNKQASRHIVEKQEDIKDTAIVKATKEIRLAT